MSPQRIQRKRTAGWRMPDNTVYVGRPSISEAVLAEVRDCCEQQGGIVAEHAKAGVALIAERAPVLHGCLRVVVIPAEPLGCATDFAPVTHLGPLGGAVGDLVSPRPRIGLGSTPEPLAAVARRNRGRAAHRTYGRPGFCVDLGESVPELLCRGAADEFASPEFPVVASHAEPASTHGLPATRFRAGRSPLRREHRHA